MLLYAVKDLAENLEIKNRNEVCLFWKGKKVEYIFRHAVILLRPGQRPERRTSCQIRIISLFRAYARTI